GGVGLGWRGRPVRSVPVGRERGAPASPVTEAGAERRRGRGAGGGESGSALDGRRRDGRICMLGADVLERWMGCVGAGQGSSCAWQPADWVRVLAVTAALFLLWRAVRRAGDLILTWRATGWSPVTARVLSRIFKSRHY